MKKKFADRFSGVEEGVMEHLLNEWRNLERKGKGSGWITLHALNVLNERAKAVKTGERP